MSEHDVEQPKEHVYATYDLGLASYLMCQGYTVTFEDSSPTKVRFLFPAQAEANAGEFIRGAQVSARLFSATIKDLKNVLATRRSASRRAQ